MGRNNKKNRQPQGGPRPGGHSGGPAAQPGDATSAAKTTPATESMTASVVGFEQRAAKDGVSLPAHGGPTEDPPEVLRDRLARLLDGYSKAEEQLGRTRSRLEAERADAERGRQEVTQLRERAEHEAADLAARREQLDARERALVAREAAVVSREAEADAGFLRRQGELLREAERFLAQARADAAAAHQGQLEEARAHAERLSDSRAAHDQRLRDLEAQAEARLAAREGQLEEEARRRREALDEERRALLEERGGVARERQRLEWERGDVEAREEAFEEHLERRLQEHLAEAERAAAVATERADRLAERCSALEAEREREREAREALGHRSPESVRAELDRLRRTEAELRTQLADRPAGDVFAELEESRTERARLEEQNASLQARLRDLEARSARLDVHVTEVQTLRDHKAALESANKALSAALKELGREVDERLAQRGGESVYPELTKLDADANLGRPDEREPARVSLATLVEDVRRDLARRSPALRYRPEDLRAFLGGLAMSRLHLLQGISGIGKSSLPRAFAEAVGGACYTIPVQAGWRDRSDLFGHYNTFERRYRESEFVKALYRANRPALVDRLVFVLLDEMNLSHPEQYGADLLDVLERTDPRERRFELDSSSPPGAQPTGLVENRLLPLPDNVWFVGTANHDETTKDFADKTYDRSFVLELPETPPRGTGGDPRRLALLPVSKAKLLEAFEEAVGNHRGAVAEVDKWLQDELRPLLSDRLGIGLGGRLGKQVGAFVPVVVEAGGTVGEALDRIVATRLLRKLKGRHDLQREDLEQVQALLERQDRPGGETEPKLSLALLERELRRL